MTLPATIGRYRVTGELGRGAMGVVYRGVDPSLDRPVAIKVIATRMGATTVSSQELEARFLREARVAARINHPGVVTVYDAGREGDSLYLVMELIEGESLAERLSRGNYPSLPDALALVARVAEALGVAHSLGIIHRDIKPGNIMLTRDGGVKVADFGVAKAVGEETNLTRTGIVVGSPAYMAPEQVRGQELDGRADLFSLGVVLYELLLRRKPFPSETVTTLIYQILHEDPLAAPEPSRLLPEEVRAFLRRCLAKNAPERILDGQTMAAEARALITRVTASAPVAVAGPTAVPPPPVATTGAAPPPPVVSTAVPPIIGSGGLRPTAVAAGGTRPPADPGATSPTVMVAAPPSGPSVGPPGPPPPPVPPPVTPPEPTRVAQTPGPERRKPRRWAELVIALVGIGLLAVAAVVLLRGRRGGPGTEVEGTATIEPPPTAVIVAEVPTPETAAAPTAPPEMASAPTMAPTEQPTPWVWPTLPPTQVPTAISIRPLSPPPVVAVEVPTATPVPPTPKPTLPPITAVFECQKGVEFHGSPDAMEVFIDGQRIGTADEWDGMGGGQTYTFAKEGTYLVRLALAGYQTVWVQVIVKSSAEEEIVDVDTDLKKEAKEKKEKKEKEKKDKEKKDEDEEKEKK